MLFSLAGFPGTSWSEYSVIRCNHAAVMKFSANLGFLWKELTLPDAIRAAAANGFSAVECHFPYTVSAQEVKTALDETGMTMIGLNTYPGNFAQGERGFCAIPGRENDARDVIEQAVAYAAEISCRNIHVMAGITSHKYARDTFIKNLVYACNKAQEKGIHIVIEPLNTRDTPGYFLTHTDQARQIINEVNRQNIKLMFDCYHVQLTEGNLTRRLSDLLPVIGSVTMDTVKPLRPG